MNFNENDLWRDKTELRLSKLPSTKVLLKLEFDTEDQVLSLEENNTNKKQETRLGLQCQTPAFPLTTPKILCLVLINEN